MPAFHRTARAAGWMLAALLATIASGVRAQAGPTLYRVTDLGDTVNAQALNDAGQVTGQWVDAAGRYHAFLYGSAGLVDLGTLVGPQGVSGGAAVNNRGQVTGNSNGATSTSYAFLYSDGTMHNIHRPGADFSAGADINDAGHVIGSYSSAQTGGIPRAMLYRDGTWSDVGPAGAVWSDAQGINNRDQVVGSAIVDSVQHAFLYENGTAIDLGTLGGDYSSAFAINERGDVLGVSSFPGGGEFIRSFLYRDGMMIDLGTFGGTLQGLATDLNDAGDLVGYFVDVERRSFAFISRDGVVTDLNTVLAPGSVPGCHLHYAFAINNTGQIGAACISDDVWHSLLLTPVPEPASAVLLIGGLAVVGTAVRSRRGSPAAR